MASLVRLGRFVAPFAAKKTEVFYNVVRPKVYTNEDWKPGPYPKTEEERKRAAKKYGLSPEEYEPYPDDGNGLGDYPKLPLIGRAARDPYYPWDDPAHRRNLHETLHRDENIIGEDRWDAGKKLPVTERFAYSMFFGVVGTIMVTFWLFDGNMFGKWHPPVMEKQIPKPGVVHYTFEPAR